jgi:hypothetical protein
MNLNDLLDKEGIEPRHVLVMRHKPREPELAKVLPWLAAEKPELFNAYQQTQSEKVEKAMLRAHHVASFIGQTAGEATFVGLYRIGEATPLSREDFWDKPVHKTLKAFDMTKLRAFGMRGIDDDPRDTVLWFDLVLTDFYAHWKGKLVISWPPPERSWWRWAHKNVMPVHSILEESSLEPDMRRWDEIDLSWDELAVLPRRIRDALAQWRGIYFIFDQADGKGYVGSAYGDTNLLGRWQDYAATGHGGDHLLRQRNPKTFRFTILQRVSPDMDPEDVIRLEASWKVRLHTRAPYGLNEN